ncbi:MAG: acyl-CoA dehydrogenase [Bacteriovoracaceae bacterium]
MTQGVNLALTTLSEEEKLFAETVRDFAQKEIKPIVMKMDEEQMVQKDLIPKLFDLGVMSIEIPEKFGGVESSFFMSVLAIEELAKVDPSVSVLVDVQNTLCINLFMNFANDALKEKYLPKLATDKIGAYGLSEASSGSDAFALKTTAKEDGDHYILNGNKLWITNSNEADIFVIFANVDPSKGYKGITAFVVERGMEGFSVGKKEDKLGIRASSTCELILDNVKVPKENIVGELGKGYKVAIETLNEGRIGIAAQMIGLAQGSLDHAINYTKERKQFGKSLIDFQGVQFELAKMATELEAARLMVYNAARLKEQGLNFVKEASMAKYFSSEVAGRVSSKAVELHGGYGFTKEYPVEKLMRDSMIGKIYEGTSNMQLMTIAKIISSD